MINTSNYNEISSSNRLEEIPYPLIKVIPLNFKGYLSLDYKKLEHQLLCWKLNN